MHRVRVALLAVALLAMGLAVAPAPAAGTASVCQFSLVVNVKPGTSLTPSQGTVASVGLPALTGSIDCTGDKVSGKGSVGLSATYGATTPGGGDTCALGTGTGTLRFKIGGTERVGNFTFYRLGAGGAFAGSITALGSIQGGFSFQPTTGDCATAPVTQATVTGAALVA